jgi:hypothetical protein
MSARTIEVGYTWNGEAVPPSERVVLTLSDRGEHVALAVDAPFHSDPPPPGPPGPTDGLWEHEVVELFVAGPGPRYVEIELGPHGHHLVLRLDGVRNAVARCLPLAFAARISGDRWHGEALIPRSWLPAGPHRVNAYAIHGVGSGRRYLAATPLPGPKPDFHQPDRFPAFELP